MQQIIVTITFVTRLRNMAHIVQEITKLVTGVTETEQVRIVPPGITEDAQESVIAVTVPTEAADKKETVECLNIKARLFFYL